jgi:hypothetical protein
MDKKIQLLIYAAAAHMLISMMAVVVQSTRKRKRCEPLEKFAMLQLMREIG